MIPALATLLACQLLGEVVVRWASLPVPGPVVGLALLLAALALRSSPPRKVCCNTFPCCSCRPAWV